LAESPNAKLTSVFSRFRPLAKGGCDAVSHHLGPSSIGRSAPFDIPQYSLDGAMPNILGEATPDGGDEMKLPAEDVEEKLPLNAPIGEEESSHLVIATANLPVPVTFTPIRGK
jgi:hypothetical protein